MTVNQDALVRVARKLEPVLDELVFVGGRVVELYLSDPLSPRPHPTKDTDSVCSCATYADYERLSQRLRQLGLKHDTSQGAHMCRWRSETDIIDVLPLDPSRFGFSSRWYKYGVESAQDYQLADGPKIRIFAPTVFVADKLDAYQGRGSGDDPRNSVDLADIVYLAAGRPEIAVEFEYETEELRTWVAEQISYVFSGDIGEETIESHLPRVADRPDLLQTVSMRLSKIAELR